MTIEYKLKWQAGSNISFHGETDWTEWGGYEDTVEDVETLIYQGEVRCEGLLEVLEASGFEWWAEIREVEDQ